MHDVYYVQLIHVKRKIIKLNIHNVMHDVYYVQLIYVCTGMGKIWD